MKLVHFLNSLYDWSWILSRDLHLHHLHIYPLLVLVDGSVEPSQLVVEEASVFHGDDVGLSRNQLLPKGSHVVLVHGVVLLKKDGHLGASL